MAETRKTKELNLLEDTPELTKKKISSEKKSDSEHEVYNKQTSDPKTEKNKFMKKWHNSKKFRIGIILGIVIVFGLSLGLGLGLGLKGEGGIFDFDDDDGKTPLAENKGDKNHIKSDFENWIADMSTTPENDIRDLENVAIIWALDQEISLGLINSSDASAAKDKAEKKADREIDNEKKEQKKADEEWDNYLTSLGFDSEEAYYNSKIANSLLSTSNVVDGLVDFDDTTSKVTQKEIDNNRYEYVSSAPKNAGSNIGEYLAITSDSFLDTSTPNTTETLMKLYLNIAKPVAFQQESISYTLNSSGNPGTNPNEWESMTFADNTQVQAAYVMAWKLDNAATGIDPTDQTNNYHYYDSAKSDTPIVPSTKSGVKHFNSLPTDLTSLAYYYAAAENTINVEEITMDDDNTGLTSLGDKANQVLIDNNILPSNYDTTEIVDDGTFDDTNITETDRRNISNEVFNGNDEESSTRDSQVNKGLSNNNLYSNGAGNKNGDRVLGKTITWNSKDEDSNDANIENKYLLTTDAAGFTLTRMENPNYSRAEEKIDTSYDLYTVGENMLENDLEKELNTPEKSSYMGIPKYGVWDDFELWVNDNAKTLALNWALSPDSGFLTNEDYHIDLMDDLINEEIDSEEIEPTKKGHELINYFYLELIVNQKNLFVDKYNTAYDFMVKDDNDDIYLSFKGDEIIINLYDQFTIFNTYIEKDGENYPTISFNDFLNDIDQAKGGNL